MKDFLKQEVKVGDTIVYATRQSSTIYMHKAEVVEIRSIKSSYRPDHEVLKVRRDEQLESPWRRTKGERLITLTNPNFVILYDGC